MVWFAKHSGSGRREGKGMTSGSKVGEGVAEAFLRGAAYILPQMGAPLPSAPGLMIEGGAMCCFISPPSTY